MNLILRERSFSDSHTDLARFRHPARESCSRCTGQLGRPPLQACVLGCHRGVRSVVQYNHSARSRGWRIADCDLRAGGGGEGRWGRDLVMGIGFYVDAREVGRKASDAEREQRGGNRPRGEGWWRAFSGDCPRGREWENGRGSREVSTQGFTLERTFL